MTSMYDQKAYDKLVSKTRIDAGSGCWIWTGFVHSKRPHPGNRYGGTSIWDPVKKKQRTMNAHRAMMWAIHGPLTPQQCVCHRCDNVLCVNPNHLFIGSMKENILDSRRKLRHYESRRDHCERGHPLFGDNLRLNKQHPPKTGFRRVCKACELGRMRMKAGWPEHLAFDMSIRVPNGYRLDMDTKAIVPCRNSVSADGDRNG